jgi:Fe-S oxidoreductase
VNSAPSREGSLEAPTRHPIDWKNPEFFSQQHLEGELERVFDICHGCRRCVSLCQAFPTLFDLVDESPTMEVDGVDKKDYGQVVDHCYLCDLCYLTKCPYVPPHQWNVDFPHLMLRAKAVRFRQSGARLRDRILTNTDQVGRMASIPVVVNAVNAANRSPMLRTLLAKALDVHANAKLPPYANPTVRKQLRGLQSKASVKPVTTDRTRGKVALFATCYGNYNAPEIASDLVRVFEHNNIPMTLVGSEQCCAMPKFELGDLDAVARASEKNKHALLEMIDNGWDIVAPVPSCVLMFKQELPLMFPDDEDFHRIRSHIFDPFEYLHLRHRHGLFNIEFRHALGTVAYHAACHQRVQNFGPRTRQVLELVPNTEVITIERCSGHDGTYAIKAETHEASMKIARPVIKRIKEIRADHYGSDCPIAANQLWNGLGEEHPPRHPISLLRWAYNI